MSESEIPSAAATEFIIGNHRYRLDGKQLYDHQNVPIALRAKSLRFLVIMLENRERIVSKSELAETVWPGLAVTDESISQCAKDIRRILGDTDHTILETFPKQGYRLNAQASGSATPNPRPVSGYVAATFLLVAFLAGFLFWWQNLPPSQPPSAGPVIAVLPFKNDGGDPDEGYLAAGLARDLTIHLSEIPDIDVVPGSLSSAINANGLKAIEATRLLGANYVVDGSLSQSGTLLRIDIELIDGSLHTLKWARTYQGTAAELISLRDSMVRDIAEGMGTAVSGYNLDRLGTTGTHNPAAFEEILRGRQAAAAFSQDALLTAERHFRKAIELDPEYARAFAELAAIYAIRFENGWTVMTAADEEKALHFGQTALELDDSLWLAHYALGRLFSAMSQKDFAKSEFHLERAMSLQPANDDARAYYGAVKNFQGKAAEAVAILQPVVSSHPNAPFWYHLALGNALFHDGQYNKAEAALDQCLKQMPSSPYCLRYQIAVLAEMGQLEDADWLIEEYQILGFEPTITAIMDLALDSSEENRARLIQAYRAAGLPD